MGYAPAVSREVVLARHIDIGATVALTWIAVAIGLTVVIGPDLGLRGWIWLGGHHLLCAVGTSHELWRARKRRQVREAAAQAAEERAAQKPRYWWD